MRSIETLSTAALLSATVLGFLGPASPARAKTPEDVAINGTYRATSIGNRAKINEQYNNEATVISTWTISSSCTTVLECTGTVTSDQGWSAPTYTHDGTLWYVKHDVPHWEKCPDGTAFTGQQTFDFYAVEGSTGYPQIGSTVMAGSDRTVGPSGACGQNKWLSVELPFRLDKIG